jgi:glyoxylase-like metal-dependent hydrolase (beta-lactamase superfamily II)
MRKITTDIYIENKFPAVNLGLIVRGDDLLLIDSPVRLEDGRSWLSQVSEYGKPRFTVLMDHHPDRILGARDLNMPLVGHALTRQHMAARSDSFKGSTHPIGADTDRLKRITGVSRSIPDLSFKERLKIRMEKDEIDLWHQPGPTPGAIWVLCHDRKVIFLGDAVTVNEPPFVGEADLDSWMKSLDVLRSSHLSSYRLISSRDGLINREDVNSMARFIRKVELRVERLRKAKDPETVSVKAADELLKGYKLSGAREEISRFRLRVGIEDLYRRLYKSDD